MNLRIAIIIIALTGCCFQPAAQPDPASLGPTPFPADSEPATATANPATSDVGGGYRNIKLGMTIDQVKQLLKKDPLFNYRGDPDVSFLPITEYPLIECSGNSYIKKGYFQFHERKLYIIILVLDPVKLDYFSIYRALLTKYGKFDSLDPSEVVWEFDEVRLSLERPLSIKYIATEVFDYLLASSLIEDDFLEMSKQQFLEQF